MRQQVFISLTALLLLASASFIACDNNGGSSEGFSREVRELLEDDFMLTDLNDDGVLDAREIQAKIEAEFDIEDRDKDGVLTAQDHMGLEYLGNIVTAVNRGEIIYDSNGDEVITFEEYSDGVIEIFIEPMDVDENGEVTLGEVLDFFGV